MPRWAFILVALAVFVGTVWYYSGIWWANVLTGFCGDVLFIALWIIPAALLGRAVLQWLSVEARGGLIWCTAAAIGLGILSLAILGMGLAGWMNRWAAFGLLAGCLV